MVQRWTHIEAILAMLGKGGSLVRLHMSHT
jgi:hypothetical protein